MRLVLMPPGPNLIYHCVEMVSTSQILHQNAYVRCHTPLPAADRHKSAGDRTCATLRPDTRVRDRSHAHTDRTRTSTDDVHHQLLTSQRYTALTVTFSRPAASRFGPRVGSEAWHARSVLRSAVGRCSLDPAHHPGGTGAGASSASSRPSRAACLAQWSSL